MKLLDITVSREVNDVVSDALDEAGFSPVEAIPGLVRAIYQQASQMLSSEQALDEAANLLADGVGE